jgi:hypothetical protein
MPRKCRAESGAAEAAPPLPSPIMPALDIRPDGVYLAEQIRTALRLRASSLKSEWRRGTLRVVRRCGRNFYLGRDLLDWLNRGELAAPERQARVAEEPAA